MQITVADYSEFIDQLFDARGDQLEVIFSSTRYEDGIFKIPCDEGYKQVTLRGREPTTLVDSSVNLCGDDVALSNCLFDSRRIFNAVFRARANNNISVNHCSWLRAFLSEQQGLSILHVEPRSPATQFELNDSWLIRNLTGAGHHILSLGAMTASAFSSLTFSRTAFIDNRSDYVIAALSAAGISICDCFVWVRDDKTVFLGARTKRADIVFSGSTFIAPSLKQVASQWAAGTTPGDFKPLRFEQCHIYLTKEDNVPDNIQLVDTTVKKISPLPDEAFEAWAQSQEAAARDGISPDPKSLRQSLNLDW